jgi:arylsulfatase A-like enzyme
VPFLIRQPGRLDSGDEFTRPVSLIDIGPTLAELCQLELHAPHEGGSLLPLLNNPRLADDRPPIMTWLEGNHAVRRDRYRYIRYRTGDVELYDHKSDPDELTNLAGRPLFADVQSELDAFLPPAGPS